MEVSVYSSFDFVAEVFSQPWLAPNDKAAIRAFGYAVSDPQFVLSKSPADYALFKLADFDDHTGKLTPVAPVIVAKGIDVFHAQQGGAVGDAIPLKSQSEPNGEDKNDAEKH